MSPHARCPDCGPQSVFHAMEWSSAFVDWLLTPLYSFAGNTARTFGFFRSGIFAAHIAPYLLDFLCAMRIARYLEAPDEHDTMRTKCLFASAKKRGIAIKEFRMRGAPHIMFFLTEYENERFAFEGLPRPRGSRSQSLDWMDNKAVMKTHMAAAGIPVARGRVCATFARAQKTFHEIGTAVITKPNLGSRSRHTTTHITTTVALAKGFKKARQLSPWVIVEEHLRGMVHRVTLVGKNIAGVIRREPPYVVGDGTHSIQTLIEKENQSPLRKGPIFHEIQLGEAAHAELARQNLTPQSIPENGRMILLHPKASRSIGGGLTDVTDIVHHENRILFEKIAAVLDDALVGIDFIIEDMSTPWHTQMPCGIIECNSLPFIDLHHYPLVGAPRDVAGMLLDVVFPSRPAGTTQSPKNS